jgi:hypothetical protein
MLLVTTMEREREREEREKNRESEMLLLENAFLNVSDKLTEGLHFKTHRERKRMLNQMDDNERKPLLIEDDVSRTTRKGENKTLISKIPKQKILLASMTLVNFFMVTCYSLLAPFFPEEVCFLKTISM